MRDPLGAFRPDGATGRRDRADGPLAGVTLAVKDVIEVAGAVAGAGNPDWERTHPAATADAPVLAALMNAGAELVGRTVLDELAFSVSGTNPHHGTPANPEAPGRTAGGSSCGAAAAVAGGMADMALATDTGGSIRVPASYCGLHGLRPTHGAVATDGVVPLAPRFDTVGLLARDAEILRAGMHELLPAAGDGPAVPAGVALATDAFGLADEATRGALTPAIADLVRRFGDAGALVLADDAGLAGWAEVFRTLQARAAMARHGDWVARVNPAFGAELAARWAYVEGVDAAAEAGAEAALPAIRERLCDLTADGTVIALPCAPGPAPLLAGEADAWAAHRRDVLALASPASLAGVPQIALPLARAAGLPVSLGLIGPPGGDRMLLDVAVTIARALDDDPGARFD